MTVPSPAPALPAPAVPALAASAAPHLLVIDADPRVRLLADLALLADGFRVSLARAAAEVLDAPATVELVVLSTRVFDAETLEAVRTLRRQRHVGVLMLADADAPEARMVALELGADDSVSPGFDDREVLVRIRAILRRVAEVRELARATGGGTGGVGPDAANGAMRFAGFVYDPATRRLTRPDGSEAVLTRVEGELLVFFAGNLGRTVSKLDISRALYGRDDDPESRAINVLVKRLRDKLEPGVAHARVLRTVRHAGYRLDIADTSR